MSFKWHVRERIVAKVLLSSQKIGSGTSSSFCQCGAFTEEVRLGRGEFFYFFSLFSLISWKEAPKLPKKKQLYTPVCNLIDFDPPFNYYLFGF